MNRHTFQCNKNEILSTVNKFQSKLETTLIDAKPKKMHDNMSENKFRGSKYRGVSKNKSKWQMMIMINQKKVYIGAIQNELDAAKYYD